MVRRVFQRWSKRLWCYLLLHKLYYRDASSMTLHLADLSIGQDIKICMVEPSAKFLSRFPWSITVFFLFLVAVISRLAFLILRCLSLLSSVLSASLENLLQKSMNDFFNRKTPSSSCGKITSRILLTFVVLMDTMVFYLFLDDFCSSCSIFFI